jgi:hypothetical protein
MASHEDYSHRLSEPFPGVSRATDVLGQTRWSGHRRRFADHEAGHRLGSAPGLEALCDLAVQQHELQRDIARVKPFGDLIRPGELRSGAGPTRSLSDNLAELLDDLPESRLHDGPPDARRPAAGRAKISVGNL